MICGHGNILNTNPSTLRQT